MRKFIGFASSIGMSIASVLPISGNAGVTAITVGSSGDVSGEDWTGGFHWNIRAILLDSTLSPVGGLSPATVFDTTAGQLTPEQVKVTLDAAAPAGSVIRVYRSTGPFNVGYTVQYADYSGLCPCVPGDLFVSVSGRLDNSDFTGSETAMPVKLQEFSVD